MISQADCKMDTGSDAPDHSCEPSSFEFLRAAVPTELELGAAQAGDDMEALKSLLKDSTSTYPYDSVSHYMLHFWHNIPPLISHNKLQMLLLILSHSEFSAHDVPKTLTAFMKPDKFLLGVPPGWQSSCLLSVIRLFSRVG